MGLVLKLGAGLHPTIIQRITDLLHTLATAQRTKQNTHMKILILRISDATTQRDMRDFVNRILKGWLRLPFSSQPTILSCRIVTITNSLGVKQRHGLINVRPDDAAQRVIRKLNGELLKGKRVGVIMFHGDLEGLSFSLI